MKPKYLSIFLLVIMAVVAVWLARRNGPGNENSRERDMPGREANRPERGLIRRVSYLDYTQHAKCRMRCRHITQAEVEDILKHGKINYPKSDPNDKPCPSYALEGYTQHDNQHVRIVFAQCDRKIKVVTCIDLDKDYTCQCN